MQIGAKFFIGYNRPFRFNGSEPYAEIAMSGLNTLLEGKDLDTTRIEMLNKYDALIAKTDPNSVVNLFLVHNKESLVFAGDSHCRYVDLTWFSSNTTQKANNDLELTAQKSETTTHKPLNTTQKSPNIDPDKGGHWEIIEQ